MCDYRLRLYAHVCAWQGANLFCKWVDSSKRVDCTMHRYVCRSNDSEAKYHLDSKWKCSDCTSRSWMRTSSIQWYARVV